MKSYPLNYSLILSLILFNICTSYAQQINNTELVHITFDKLVGLENTSLYQGKIYIEKFRAINKNKQFFKSAEFLSGDVCYKGQPYFNQLLKYDVYEDELLLKIKGNGNTLKLSKKDIDSFSIEKNHFVNLKSKILPAQLSGFYEVLFKDDKFILYGNYNKNLIERTDKNYVYFEFTDAKTKYLLLYQGEYHSLDSKKEILNMFPNYRKKIKQLYKRTKNLNSTGDSDHLIMFVKQLNSIFK